MAGRARATCLYWSHSQKVQVVKCSSLVKLFLESQPFSVLLGAELEIFEPGTAVLALVVCEELKQQHGFVHGGILSYLADNALTYAGGSVLGDSVTSEYKINYLRPAMGKKLNVH